MRARLGGRPRRSHQCGHDAFLCAARRLAAPTLIPNSTCHALNNKESFAAILAHAGLPAPRTLRFENPADLRAALGSRELAGPCVVKPLEGSGGVGVWRLDPKDPSAVWDRIDYAPILLQRFVKAALERLRLLLKRRNLRLRPLCAPARRFHFHSR